MWTIFNLPKDLIYLFIRGIFMCRDKSCLKISCLWSTSIDSLKLILMLMYETRKTHISFIKAPAQQKVNEFSNVYNMTLVGKGNAWCENIAYFYVLDLNRFLCSLCLPQRIAYIMYFFLEMSYRNHVTTGLCLSGAFGKRDHKNCHFVVSFWM